jgi:exopolysaccharide biosynthesis polyprenyl glycosylphosphotransferase
VIPLVLVGDGPHIEEAYPQYPADAVWLLTMSPMGILPALHLQPLDGGDGVQLPWPQARVYVAAQTHQDAQSIANRLSSIADPIYWLKKERDTFHVTLLRRGYQHGIGGWMKRMGDVVLSMMALCLLAPVFFCIACLIAMESNGGVFYQQARWGRNGAPFKIFKFRTMYQKACDNGYGVVKQAEQDDARITRIGAFLRKTSIDELPQLINILKGDMSLVGPRPHAVAHNLSYQRTIKGYMMRHRVPPGLTGLAQVHGFRGETRTDDEMQRRIQMDNTYIDTWSFMQDIKIIFKTVGIVLSRKNAY